MVELIGTCSKTIRCEDYIDDEKMIEEVGDVLVMIDLMIERGLVKKEDLES